MAGEVHHSEGLVDYRRENRSNRFRSISPLRRTRLKDCPFCSLLDFLAYRPPF